FLFFSGAVMARWILSVLFWIFLVLRNSLTPREKIEPSTGYHRLPGVTTAFRGVTVAGGEKGIWKAAKRHEKPRKGKPDIGRKMVGRKMGTNGPASNTKLLQGSDRFV